MASATAPPTPVSISSKTSVGAEPLSASTTFRASMKRASSPPDATFISGPGFVPGLVWAQNSTRSKPGGIAALLVRRDLGDEAGALEPQRRQLLLHRAVERLRGAPPAGGERSRRRDVGGVGLGDRALERAELFLAGVDRLHVGGVALAELGEPIGRHGVFPRRGAKREQPLLGLLELARIELGLRGSPARGRRGPRRSRRAPRRAPGRKDRRAPAPAPPRRSSLRSAAESVGTGEPWPASVSKRIGEVLRHLLGLHHDETALGERRLLAGLRRERAELLDGMAQEIGRLAGALDPGAMLVQRRPRLAQGARRRFDRARLGLQAAEGVEDRAVRRRIDERALVMLAVDLDERGADRAQHLHAHRLVVDEGAGAAVRELHPAQDEVAVGVDLGALGDAARRMVAGEIEDGGDLPLRLAVAHEPAVAAGAERQRKGVEEDRFAGAGLAGQDREALVEVELDPVDQDDVADRELREHPRRASRRVPPCGSRP